MLALQRGLAAHLRDPQGVAAPESIEPRRLAIYRRLLFNNLSNLYCRNFPVIRRLFDDAEWDALIRDFMIHQRPSTPMFTQIGSEFVCFLQQRGERGNEDPPWLAELAHWEYLETCVRLHSAEPQDVEIDGEVDLLDGTPLINPTLKLAGYQWPVHRIGPDYRPEFPEPHWLAVWRRRDDEVRFVRVNALTAGLIEMLLEPGMSSSGRECLRSIADQVGQPTVKVIEAGLQIMETLRSREIILGARRAAETQ